MLPDTSWRARMRLVHLAARRARRKSHSTRSTRMPTQATLTKAESILKIAALCGAGLFFAWKLSTGWLIANVQLTVTGSRMVDTTGVDWLAVAITVDKGSTDAIWLERASVKVSPRIEGDEGPIDLAGFQRLRIVDGKIDWSAPDENRKGWPISPGETLQLATYLRVPAGKPVLIEAAISGRRPWWPYDFQWRATSVSLPRVPAPPPPTANCGAC